MPSKLIKRKKKMDAGKLISGRTDDGRAMKWNITVAHNIRVRKNQERLGRGARMEMDCFKFKIGIIKMRNSVVGYSQLESRNRK